MEKLECRTEAMEATGAAVIHVSGAVDVFSYKDLKTYFDEWMSKGNVNRLMVNMSGITYVGSSGWSVMFLQAAAMEKRSGALALYAMSERVRRSLDLIMPKKRGIIVTDTFDQALEELKAVKA